MSRLMEECVDRRTVKLRDKQAAFLLFNPVFRCRQLQQGMARFQQFTPGGILVFFGLTQLRFQFGQLSAAFGTVCLAAPVLFRFQIANFLTLEGCLVLLLP